jgi:hypothetical protein
MNNTSCNAIQESPHLDMIITEELIARAESLGACESGVRAARKLMGQPIRQLPSSYADWSALLYDGMSVQSDGTRLWHVNGMLHRDDGPAVERANGTREWWLNGLRHREDGPAIERVDGYRLWCVNGERVSPEDFPRAVTAYLANLATA